MSLKVYNTLTKQKEEFKPLTPGKVKMYVCGVTPYNHPHIGNARPFITWDVIRRYLEFSGYEVYHIQNFTDVDDKIIKTANTEHVTWDVIANRYIASYFEVMDKLGIRRAHVYPRVSEHIPDIVAMVKTLIDKGFAYEVDGDVYYSVQDFPGYGKLSGRNLEDMKAGARIDVDERKKHPMDFALWKSAKPGEPSWQSPWGQGRPGWHIECSVMSCKYLGASFDLHGGGSDLIFPHHENEIAQSEAFTGIEPFVRYWLHNGFITVNEEKMSKSLGNFFLVVDILEHFQPEVLRFFILSTHYRSPLDFNDERLQEAGRSLDRLKTAKANLQQLKTLPAANGGEDSQELTQAAIKAMHEFTAAMDDDFNTALAISTMFGLAKEINIYHSKITGGKAGLDAGALEQAGDTFDQMAEILGILNDSTAAAQDGNEELINELMQIIIDIRQEARKKKEWATADQIRDRLAAAGIILEDSPQGVRWKRQ
ncbi:cysteine--tRNA ligase [Sporomusa acidovorans]|uniref:Cysteine--tRNA ligase n=1 Tax=Sporomusa acidovorans (strain ATCC 49682 / DSM 3132 / Mol) TaxID=1123286 RepID=A0ABZ3IWI5_SPOA4|nr:cysteine--tRNA ligase [Sporomusa acidovorans]OZC13883.1 cysteine--tRNA ligase [Sporomusa acidovorans DSM 3132]SDF48799.1 cysteinyl-tRNA synthetase [Sporomusa acidovorans]